MVYNDPKESPDSCVKKMILEEIVNVVQSKRKNLDYMHKILAKKNK